MERTNPRLNYELSFEEVGGFEQSINSRSKISNSILPFSSVEGEFKMHSITKANNLLNECLQCEMNILSETKSSHHLKSIHERRIVEKKATVCVKNY